MSRKFTEGETKKSYYMKRCSISLVIRGMQIKMRSLYTNPTGKIRTLDDAMYCQGYAEMGSLIIKNIKRHYSHPGE